MEAKKISHDERRIFKVFKFYQALWKQAKTICLGVFLSFCYNYSRFGAITVKRLTGSP